MSPHCNAYLPADLESDSLLYAAIIYDCHMGRAGTLILHSAQVFMVFVVFNYSVLGKQIFFQLQWGLFQLSTQYRVHRCQDLSGLQYATCNLQSQSKMEKKNKNWNVSELCVVCLSIAPAKVSFFSENSVTDHIFLAHRRAKLLILAKQSTITERYISNTPCKAF